MPRFTLIFSLRHLTDIRIYYDGVSMVQNGDTENGRVMRWRWGGLGSRERRFGLELGHMDFWSTILGDGVNWRV